MYIHNYPLMESQQGNEKGAIATTDNDANIENVAAHIVEIKKEDFKGWMLDTSTRHIINNVVINHHRAVKLEMVSDTVAWNIANLTQPIDWQIPQTAVDLKTKKKAVEWIKHFKSYAMSDMKKKWESEYVKLFNSEKYTCLREGCNSNVLSFKCIREMTKTNTTGEVRIFVSIICLIVFIIHSLNLNFHVCHFSLNNRRGGLNFLN